MQRHNSADPAFADKIFSCHVFVDHSDLNILSILGENFMAIGTGSNYSFDSCCSQFSIKAGKPVLE
jgi:hypothetical protein